MDLAITKLRKERDEARAKADACQAALAAYCKAIGHAWEEDGHDSHYDWEKCTTCDQTRKV